MLCNRFLSLTALVAALTMSSQAAGSEIITQVNPGNERALSSVITQIEATDGITLQRVSDGKDAFWALSGDATVLARARYSLFGNVFGILQGTSGGSFVGVVAAPDSNGVTNGLGPVTQLPNLSGDFRLAMYTATGQTFSSLGSDNQDSMDHMVTWVDINDRTHYFVGFEDLLFPGSDGDFNDIVLELRNVLDGPTDAAAAVPEPATLALIGLGLAGLGYSRRRKAHSASKD